MCRTVIDQGKICDTQAVCNIITKVSSLDFKYIKNYFLSYVNKKINLRSNKKKKKVDSILLKEALTDMFSKLLTYIDILHVSS